MSQLGERLCIDYDVEPLNWTLSSYDKLVFYLPHPHFVNCKPSISLSLSLSHIYFKPHFFFFFFFFLVVDFFLNKEKSIILYW